MQIYNIQMANVLKQSTYFMVPFQKYSMKCIDECNYLTLSDLLKTSTTFSCKFFNLYIGHVFFVSRGTAKTGFNLYIVINWKIQIDDKEHYCDSNYCEKSTKNLKTLCVTISSIRLELTAHRKNTFQH